MIDFLKFNDDISDEMLAAYIDGNASDEEIGVIQSQIKNDDLLSEVIEVSSEGLNYLSCTPDEISRWNNLLGIDDNFQLSLEDDTDNSNLNFF